MTEDPQIHVLVTRPREAAQRTAAAVAEIGFVPLIDPMLVVEPTEAELPPPMAVQAVVSTSAEGLRRLAAAWGRTHETAAELARVPAYVVGEASAAAARACGFVTIESAGRDGQALVRLITHRLDPSGAPLLHPRGGEVALDLAAALAPAGFRVLDPVVYRARPAPTLMPRTQRALAAGTVRAALFFSARTAESFVDAAERSATLAGLAAVRALCLSEAIAAALGTAPFRTREVAAAPTEQGLIDLLDQE